MKENKVTVIIVGIVFLLMCAYVFMFQVRTTEMAIHYRPPGTVHRVINAAAEDGDGDQDASGLYFRLPYPIDQVRRFDKRTRVIDGPLAQTQLQDEWQVIVSISAPWRISDPVLFEQNLGGNVERATQHLRDIIFSETSNAISDLTFRNLVSTNADDLKFEEMEEKIRDGARASIEAQGHGIELLDFGIRRIAIPETTTEGVFERMMAERERVAETYLAEGRSRQQEIIAEAEREAQNIRAEAMAEAKRIESEGEEIEAQFYEYFARAPELAIYLRRLESIRNIAERAREEGSPISFVLDTKSEPLSVLYSGPLGDYGTSDPIQRAISDASGDDNDNGEADVIDDVPDTENGNDTGNEETISE